MDHMPWLLERSKANGGLEPCGHALMASCPPEPFPELTPDIPFGHKHGSSATAHQLPPTNRPNNNAGFGPNVNRNFSRGGSRSALAPALGLTTNGDSAQAAMAMDVDSVPPRTWELSKADLATLLDLSQKLNLDGEITPVMAWGMVLGHPRLGELNEKDCARLAEELRSKVRCYG